MYIILIFCVIYTIFWRKRWNWPYSGKQNKNVTFFINHPIKQRKLYFAQKCWLLVPVLFSRVKKTLKHCSTSINYVVFYYIEKYQRGIINICSRNGFAELTTHYLKKAILHIFIGMVFSVAIFSEFYKHTNHSHNSYTKAQFSKAFQIKIYTNTTHGIAFLSIDLREWRF